MMLVMAMAMVTQVMMGDRWMMDYGGADDTDDVDADGLMVVAHSTT